MKVKVEFGTYDGTEIISWYKGISDFPKLVRWQGNVYEFALYQEDTTHQNDYIFNLSRVTSYPGKYYEIPSFTDMFGSKFDDKCSCGAKYDKGNPNYHFLFCPKWKIKP